MYSCETNKIFSSGERGCRTDKGKNVHYALHYTFFNPLNSVLVADDGRQAVSVTTAADHTHSTYDPAHHAQISFEALPLPAPLGREEALFSLARGATGCEQEEENERSEGSSEGVEAQKGRDGQTEGAHTSTCACTCTCTCTCTSMCSD